MSSGNDPPAEQLIIVTGQLPEGALKGLRERYQVTQSVSNRVFLVRAQPSLGGPTPESLHIFSTAEIPEEVLNSLDERESLFVAAWRSRLLSPPKKRPGEGLDWDAPGFKPPR